MARIFVALYNFANKKDDFNTMPPFFESFLKGLKDAGNQVLCFHHKTYGRQFNSKFPSDIMNRVKNFDPELCILFNNNFWDISQIVDCPIVIYDVDSPLEYAGLESIKNNVSRYLFVVNQTLGIQTVMDVLKAEKKQIRYIPFFSEVRSDPKVEPINNIVFLGTNWLWEGYNFVNTFIKNNPSNLDRKFARSVLDEFTNNPLEDLDFIYKKLDLTPNHRINFINQKRSNGVIINGARRAVTEISGLRRVRYLSSVVDLGLEIRGTYWNIECLNYFPEVLLCYNKEQVYSLKESQNFYNSAKIALNTKSIQAKNGFSFRVCDIMASNSCLVTEYCKDIGELFPNVGIPCFTTPQEVYEQCKKLLDNEDYRLEIVTKANEAIDSGFRFKHVLENLEDFLNLKLHSEFEGSLEIFIESKTYEDKKKIPQAEQNIKVDTNNHKVGKIINNVKTTYYKSLGKHLGYDPYHIYKTEYIYLFKIPILKIMQVKPSRKEIYCLFIPIISISNSGERKIAKLLLIEKLNNGFKKVFRWIKK